MLIKQLFLLKLNKTNRKLNLPKQKYWLAMKKFQIDHKCQALNRRRISKLIFQEIYNYREVKKSEILFKEEIKISRVQLSR